MFGEVKHCCHPAHLAVDALPQHSQKIFRSAFELQVCMPERESLNVSMAAAFAGVSMQTPTISPSRFHSCLMDLFDLVRLRGGRECPKSQPRFGDALSTTRSSLQAAKTIG